MADLYKILKKKNLTGRDLGRLVLLRAAQSLRYQMEGGDEPPLPMNAIINRAEQLSKQTDIDAWDGFVHLQGLILELFNAAQMHCQQGQFRFMMLFNHIQKSMYSEDFLRYHGNLPVIMTVEQYEQCMKDSVESCLKAEDGSDRMANLFEIVLSWTKLKAGASGSIPNEITPAQSAYRHAPVTDSRLLSRLDALEVEDGRKRHYDDMWTLLFCENLEKIFPPTGDNAIESATLFAELFPEVVNAALPDICRLFALDSPAVNVPVKEWSMPVLSYRRLYEKDFPGAWSNPAVLFGKDARAMRNGIAVIQPWHMGSTSEWREPYLQNPLGRSPLEDLYPENERSEDVKARMKHSWKLLRQSFLNVRGFYSFIEIVSEIFKLDDFSIYMKIADKHLLTSKISTLNKSSNLLRELIRMGMETLPHDVQELKAKIVDEVFPVMDVSENLPDDAIGECKKLLNGFKLFRDETTLKRFKSLLFDAAEERA